MHCIETHVGFEDCRFLSLTGSSYSQYTNQKAKDCTGFQHGKLESGVNFY